MFVWMYVCQATAITYFKRFYLVASPIEYVPRKVVAAVILLAAKSEEARINSGELATLTGCKLKDITSLELTLLQCLKFHLRVFHAYRALRGYTTALGMTEVEKTGKEKRSRQLIEMSFFTGTDTHIRVPRYGMI